MAWNIFKYGLDDHFFLKHLKCESEIGKMSQMKWKITMKISEDWKQIIFLHSLRASILIGLFLKNEICNEIY